MRRTLAAVVRWLSLATGVGYNPPPPLDKEPARCEARDAARRLKREASSITIQLRRLERRLEREMQ